MALCSSSATATVCLAAGSHSYLPLKFNEIALPYPHRRCSIAFTCAKDQSAVETIDPVLWQRPDSFGRFGKFGGKYLPETLMYALTELEAAFKFLATDDDFQVPLHIFFFKKTSPFEE